jgi:hypothetical protein
MTDTAACTSLYTPRDSRNIRNFTLWLFAAMASFMVASILIRREIIDRGPLAYALTGLTIALLLVMLRAYIVFIREADELLRKVQLEALALSFGATIVFMLGYRLCERLGALKLDVDDPMIVMSLVFAIGQWIGMRRYAGGEQ